MKGIIGCFLYHSLLIRNSDRSVRLLPTALFLSGLSVTLFANSCGRQESQPPSSPAQTATNLQVGAGQNDPQGYDGLAWGSAPADHSTQPLDGAFNLQPVLNKVFGAPGKAEDRVDERGFGGLRLGSRDTRGDVFFEAYEVGTPKLDFAYSKDTFYLYYRGQLALVVTTVHDYDRAESELSRKYPVSREVTADSWGEGSNETEALAGSRVGGIFTGRVYRRGDTNTRIYLLQQLIDGFRRDVFLVYIPEVYFSAIHHEWWENFQHTEQQTAQERDAHRHQLRESDQRKIQ